LRTLRCDEPERADPQQEFEGLMPSFKASTESQICMW
jgi:hypothetical protein